MLSPNLIDCLGAALDLRDLHVLAREIRRADNQRRWRRGTQQRATRLGAVLRAVERVLGDRYVWRLREAGSWKVFGRNGDGGVVLVAIIGGGPRRTLDDLRAPVAVTVVEPSLIDVDRLRQEARSGT